MSGDSDLLQRIPGGDEEAFLEFYRRHQGAVYRFALQMSGKTEIAEEVTQDVFMVVIRAAQPYDSKRGSVHAYLYGIARNFILYCAAWTGNGPTLPCWTIQRANTANSHPTMATL